MIYKYDFFVLVYSDLAAFITSLHNTSVPTATCFPFHIPRSSGGLPWFDHSAVVLVLASLGSFSSDWYIAISTRCPATRAWLILRILRTPIICDSVNSALSSEFVLRPYVFSPTPSFLSRPNINLSYFPRSDMWVDVIKLKEKITSQYVFFYFFSVLKRNSETLLNNYRWSRSIK